MGDCQVVSRQLHNVSTLVSSTSDRSVIDLVFRGDAGFIDHVEIDTAHHMGNFPMASVPACPPSCPLSHPIHFVYPSQYAELHAIYCQDVSVPSCT